MIYLSVCSGIEAATVAWHPLGWKPAAFSEIEAFPSAVLAHHYPDTPNLGDMTRFKEWPEYAIDLLVGGTPCQSFSVAGLRKGLADPRGNLMLTYLAIAARYRPRWLVWENVPGVLSSTNHSAPDPCPPENPLDMECDGQEVDIEDEYDSEELHAFNCFLGGLSELGYGFAYRVLDAQYFGVPQRRRRVFVVGYLGDWRFAAAVLFERHSLQGHTPPSRKAGKGVAALTSTGVGTCGADDNQAQAWHLIPDTATLTCGDRGMSVDQAAGGMAICMESGQPNAGIGIGCTLNASHEQAIVAHTLRGEGFDASPRDDTDTTLIPILEIGKGTTSRGAGPNGCGIGNEGDLMDTLQANAQHAVAFQPQASRTQSMNVSEICPTIGTTKEPAVAFHKNQRHEITMNSTAGSLKCNGGKPGQGYPAALQGSAVRRLTPRECERLQGFPDDYTLIPIGKTKSGAVKMAKDGPRYKALGNSMARVVMEWLGIRIDQVEAIIGGT